MNEDQTTDVHDEVRLYWYSVACAYAMVVSGESEKEAGKVARHALMFSGAWAGLGKPDPIDVITTLFGPKPYGPDIDVAVLRLAKEIRDRA